MRFLGTVQLFLLSAASFYVLASLLVSAAVPPAVRGTAAWSPASRHRALTIVSVAPLLLAVVAVLSAWLPSLLALRWPEFDHCLVHDDGHPHMCFTHLSEQPGAWAGWLFLASAFAWVTVHVTSGTATLLGASRLLRRLERTATLDAGRNVWVIPTNRALCLSVGVLRPRLLLSSGLLARIDADEQEIMIAHEQAHQRRKDTLTRLLARAATLSLLPVCRDRLLAALELSSEQACDEEAALCVGDRLRVAETILAMERRLTLEPGLRDSLLVAGFGSSTVPERVEAMLRPTREPSASAAPSLVLLALMVALLASSEHLHHVTESVLAHASF